MRRGARGIASRSPMTDAGILGSRRERIAVYSATARGSRKAPDSDPVKPAPRPVSRHPRYNGAHQEYHQPLHEPGFPGGAPRAPSCARVIWIRGGTPHPRDPNATRAPHPRPAREQHVERQHSGRRGGQALDAAPAAGCEA